MKPLKTIGSITLIFACSLLTISFGSLMAKSTAINSLNPIEAAAKDPLQKRESKLTEMLLDVVEKDMKNCPLSFIIDSNYSHTDTISHLLMLPNPKQVIVLNSIEDLNSIVWSQGFCSAYFFLLNDLHPLLKFCDESEDEWDYNGWYVVVTQNTEDLEKMTDTVKGRKTEQILGMTPARSSNRWNLYSNKFYWENGVSKMVSNTKRGKKTSYFPDKVSDLKGTVIKLITFQWLPSIFFSKNKDGTIQNSYGIEVEVVKAVARAMNFKLQFEEPPKGELWGSKVSEGNWTGLLGKLFRSEGDIGIANIFISASRGEAVAFSASFDTQMACFLCGMPSSLPQWQSLLLPFQAEMWVAYLVSIFACGIILCFFIRKPTEMLYCIFISLQAHLKESSVFNSEIISVRVFVGIMGLYCIILTTAYSSKLTAFLTVTRKPSTYETIHEFYETNLPVFGLSPFFKKSFTSSADETLHNLGERFVVFTESEIFFKIVHGEGAYMQDQLYLEYMMETKLKHKTRLMKECFAPYNVAMVLQKHSPLKRKIDIIIKRIVASGLVRKWFEESIVIAKNEEWTNPKESLSSDVSPESNTTISLTLTHLQGVFLIYLVLCSLTFFTFIVEIVTGRINKEK